MPPAFFPWGEALHPLERVSRLRQAAAGRSEWPKAPCRRRRLRAAAEKERVYGETYPLDEEFLEALALMPPASGIAMGFDRLVMLATGAPRIDEVIWAPAG